MFHFNLIMEQKHHIQTYNIIITLLITALLLTRANCQKYLTIDQIDSLTGNNCYLSKADIESNLAFIYSRFFQKIQESWVMGDIGEARSGEIFPSPQSGDARTRPIDPDERQVVQVLGRNNLLDA